jgi:hypothetical protein
MPILTGADGAPLTGPDGAWLTDINGTGDNAAWAYTAPIQGSNTTLYLLPDTWDLTADAFGNIALASEPYALAQDAASAIRTFEGECYYDTTQGLPYWQQILGKMPPLSLVRQKMVDAALSVPGVVSARVFFSGFDDGTRQLSGQVQVTNAAGELAGVGF